MIAASVATNAASSSSSKNTSSTTSSSSTTTDATSVDLTDSTIGIVEVAHLGGIKAGCRISGGAIDRTKPTFLLINASLVTAAIFDVQFANRDLTDAVNLVAVEPLGHGATTCSVEHFTYWDSAVMTLLVLDQLGLDRVYVLGMGQGAFIGVRMALLSPERVKGLLLLGTSLDYESADSRAKGAWDAGIFMKPFIDTWSIPKADFVLDDLFCDMVSVTSFGSHNTPERAALCGNTVRQVYSGDEGRKKVRGVIMALLTRDGLLVRLGDVKCPVHWLQGENSGIYDRIMPTEQIKMFTSAPWKELTFIPDAPLFLNATNPTETSDAMLNMIKRCE